MEPPFLWAFTSVTAQGSGSGVQVSGVRVQGIRESRFARLNVRTTKFLIDDQILKTPIRFYLFLLNPEPWLPESLFSRYILYSCQMRRKESAIVCQKNRMSQPKASSIGI